VKAIIQTRYGDPAEVLRVEEIPVPEVGPREVLVRVRATPISGDAWHLTRAGPMSPAPSSAFAAPRVVSPASTLPGR
jgi:NADPH:quinone reductase-like Zn-dependent oxidoreductase